MPNLENHVLMANSDALWLDVRLASESLSTTEISNLTSFIASGRRVVMIGEHDSWASWNNQLLGIVGGSYNSDFLGNTNSIVTHELTNGVSTVTVGQAGRAFGGTSLFDQNFATLWGPSNNVLTILDMNIIEDTLWGNEDNGQFVTNVANWIAAPAPVPEPSTMLLLGSGLVGMIGFRKKKESKA